MQDHLTGTQWAMADKEDTKRQGAELQSATDYAAQAGKLFIGGEFVDGVSGRHTLL